MPIVPRSRSAATLENDRKILDAALAEALAGGIDGLGLGPVAKRAGVTTGAMYSRYVDSQDMLATLWTERLAEPTKQLLADCVGTLVGASGPVGAQLAKRLTTAPKGALIGVEALIAARRLPELEEVLVDEISVLLRELGVTANSDADPIARLRGALALSVSLACVMNNFWEKEAAEWAMILDFYALCFALMKPSTTKPIEPLSPAPIVVETDSELRNVLIRAASDVVGRSGVQAATVARIARRAKMTTGAVYTLYETKGELLIDAMEQMLASAAADISLTVRSGAKTNSVAEATADVFALGLAPERRPWRAFRLEVYLAARTDRDVARVVRKIQHSSLARYQELYSDQGMSDETIRLLSRSGQNLPLGLSIVEQFVPDFASLDFRTFGAAMVEAQKIAGR